MITSWAVKLHEGGERVSEESTGYCLSSLRVRAGLTEKQVCRVLEISRKTWNNWLWGISEPSQEQRNALAKLLGCPVESIDICVARDRASWERSQRRQEIDANAPESSKNSTRGLIIETIIQIVVSVVASVITTLVYLGKI